MLTVRDAAQALGTTERAVRLRLDALRPEVDAYLRKGRNGQVVLTDGAWAMVRRMEELRQADGLTVNLAGELVRREVSEPGNGQVRATATQGNGHDGEALRVQVELLKAENARLWGQVERLTAMLDEAQDKLLALPAPKARPWWAWLWGRG